MSTVLIVDDLSTNRDVLISILHHRGHRLLTASNGNEAFAIARTERPDLVITDVLMPVMDGYELVKQLRQTQETERIPVVFYTAHYGEREARALALSSGVADVLAKPVDPEAVLRVVERALSTPVPARASDVPQLTTEFDREHLRLVTDKLSDKARDLSAANARLRGLINIGLELASERDAVRLLQNVAANARDLFGATYVTLGLVSRQDGTLERLVIDGTDARAWIDVGHAIPGLLASIVGGRHTLRGDNPTGDPVGLGLPADHPPIGAYVAAPIASPVHVYGWLCLVGNEGRTFTEEDEALLAALSGQVGRIYENGYFYSVARIERDRAQRYLDTARVILLGRELDGRITLVNRYACNLFGWTAEELSGRDFIQICVPDALREAARAELREVLAGRSEIVTGPIVTKDGELRVIEWRTTVLREDDGRPTGMLSSGTDVTERVRAETQVRLQSTALTAAANGIMITDRLGTIEWVNPAFEEMTGYAAVEALGRNPRDLVKSDQHDPAFYKSLWDTIQAGHVWRGEIINRRKTGSLYYEEQSITPVRGDKGAIEHFIAIKQDVSPRKRYEEELRERSRLSALSADVGLALNRAETLGDALQQCAHALVTRLGASFGRIWTLNEKHVLELRASAGLYTHLDGAHSRVPIGQFKIGRIAQRRKPHLTNSVLSDPEIGDQEWARREGMVAFAGHPLIVGDRLLGVMAMFAQHPLSDSVLTALASVADHIALGIERHRSRDALRAAEERMRFALESAQVGIWDIDYPTGVVRWSEILERHCGLKPETFGGTFDAFMAAIHPDDRQSVMGFIDNADKVGSDFILPDFRVVWPDRTVHWLNGAGRIVLGANREPVRGVGVALDVSARRKLEEQYHQAQKMEAIGRLAGGVAHDFNNLLTAILGYCELLLAEGNETDARRKDIVEIQNAGLRAAGLTRQLLALSRKQIIEPAILDLNAIVSGLESMLARLIGEDIDVRLRLSADIGHVKADRGQIEQVLLNLVVNARDAMPKGGAITIETADVELDENYVSKHPTAKPGKHVMLAVTDTGTGMTPEVQDRLFEPFFTTKAVGKGTGLGLATIHGIVAQTGGSIGVRSEPGKGTAFHVYLPWTDAETQVSKPALSDAHVHHGTHTVLVVEDEEGLRELTKRLLMRHGYSVLIAANADEAVRLFEDHQSIDVLLTDVVMPGASGPELTRKLVESQPRLKIIYMSGYTEEAIVHHGVLNPDVAFLHKPFTSDTLADKLREVLEE